MGLCRGARQPRRLEETVRRLDRERLQSLQAVQCFLRVQLTDVLRRGPLRSGRMAGLRIDRAHANDWKRDGGFVVAGSGRLLSARASQCLRSLRSCVRYGHGELCECCGRLDADGSQRAERTLADAHGIDGSSA